MTQEKQDNAAPKLTRLPLERVWFSGDPQDFPQGNSQQQSIIFEPQKHKGRQYFLGYFVPSFQVVQIEWYKNEETEPELFSVPMSGVKRMKHSTAKKA